MVMRLGIVFTLSKIIMEVNIVPLIDVARVANIGFFSSTPKCVFSADCAAKNTPPEKANINSTILFMQ